MAFLWTTIFYQPLFNLLVLVYDWVWHDMGLAIIVITIILKLVLYPLSKKSLVSQRALQQIQPKMAELKEKYKGQKDVLAREMMALYQKEKVSPLSSCLPVLVQLPFLIALYQVFRNSIKPESMYMLYSFIPNPGELSNSLFGFWNLGTTGWANWPIALLTGAAQYWQAKMLVTKKPTITAPASRDESITATVNKQMLYIMPIMTIFFGIQLPGGLVLYWLANTLLTILQQYFTFKSHDNKQLSVS